ncbi:MAG: hypothetical protein HYV77_03615 [Candidatus Wildermuthbacteria bacterium]|nr:hypothetical protein [Candidatus Wildermuthbacteria bacterium]
MPKNTEYKKYQQGFAALYLVVILMITGLGIILSIVFVAVAQQRVVAENTRTVQAYYAAESGVEDGLLRLHNSMTLPGSYPYTIQVGSAQAEVAISDLFSGSRTVTSSGNSLGRVRVAEAVYEITATNAEFFYGAHIGEGGLRMSPNSGVFGNVFSNGDVAMGNNAGIGSINSNVTGSVIIAGASKRLYHTSGGTAPFVNGDATVDICDDISIVGTLTANTSIGCGSIDIPLGAPPSPIPLPLSGAEIQSWKDAAAAGGIVNGDVTIPETGVPTILGREKIAGNLTLENNVELILTGTLWVTGNINFGNGANVHLDSGYGSTSGMIIADGVIDLGNNTIAKGSGSAGSYLMFLSTASLDPSIVLGTNNDLDVLYASNGWIRFQNVSRAREITGYGIELGNGVGIYYEVGLQNTQFVNGTGGGWTVASWKETE